MHITLDRSHFLKAVAHGQSVVEKRNTLSILGNVLLQASADGVSFTTTNMDMALVEKIPASVLQPGQTTASANLLYDIVRKLPEAALIEVVYLPETAQLRVTAGRSRFHLPCLPSEDFPQLYEEALPSQFSVEVGKFRRLIDGTKFAMSTEETRHYLSGIHFHTLDLQGGTTLRAVATDSHRLACLGTLLDDGVMSIPPIIIGRKTITELRKLLDEPTEIVTVKLSPTRVQFELGNATLSSRLIDGVFPDYETAIPRQNPFHLRVKTKDFFSAVDRVATVSLDDLHAIKFCLSDNILALSAIGQEAGSSYEELSVSCSTGDPVEIGFNARYLLDIADHIEDEETLISFQDSHTAVTLSGANDSTSLYVLMPIRV